MRYSKHVPHNFGPNLWAFMDSQLNSMREPTKGIRIFDCIKKSVLTTSKEVIILFWLRLNVEFRDQDLNW